MSISSRRAWLHNDRIIVVARFTMMLSTTSILRTTSSSGIAGQTLESLLNHAVSYLAEPKAAVVLSKAHPSQMSLLFWEIITALTKEK